MAPKKKMRNSKRTNCNKSNKYKLRQEKQNFNAQLQIIETVYSAKDEKSKYNVSRDKSKQSLIQITMLQ